MQTSEFLKINVRDLVKTLVVTVLAGCALPILIALQSPDFNFATTNWQVLLSVAFNGGISAGAAYLVKNLFTDSQGKFAGVV